MSSLLCMALAIYFEARSEHILGQLLVGQTIMNRVEDPRWPNTVCGVVKQYKQFSFFWDGKPEKPKENSVAWRKALIFAEKVLEGRTKGLTDATHYHTLSTKPSWARYMEKRIVVGNHIFYKG